jgi:hypothetical protein
MTEDAEAAIHTAIQEALSNGDIGDHESGMVTGWSLVGSCIDQDGTPGWFFLEAPEQRLGNMLGHAIQLDEFAREQFRKNMRAADEG